MTDKQMTIPYLWIRSYILWPFIIINNIEAQALELSLSYNMWGLYLMNDFYRKIHWIEESNEILCSLLSSESK